MQYLESLYKQLVYYKQLAEKAMKQLAEEQLFWQYNEESNSPAVLVKHLAGNMRSRFTDFLTSDGEKPWRDRDGEFVNTYENADAMWADWNSGWAILLDTVSALREEDLQRIVYIRNEGHTVVEALNRQLAHYPYHIGQIVFIAKMLKNTAWNTLSIARNASAKYNTGKFSQEKGIRHFTDEWIDQR